MAKSSFEGFLRPRPDRSGTETGDATATAGDIASGKTAYAVGRKITGTGANVKPYKSGTVTSSASTLLFTRQDGSSVGFNYVTVSNLGLSSGIGAIMVRRPGSSDNTIYNVNPLNTTGPSNIANISIGYFQLTGNGYANSSGFQLPVSLSGVSYEYEVWGV